MLRRQDVKELLPILQSFAEGKQIQDKIEGLTDWVDTDVINFKYEGQKIKHRIKPEPKYRPFKTKEECWEEMHKHPDFGWVRLKINSSLYHIDMVGNNNLIADNAYKGLKAVFQSFEFTDGTPFGIKEE